MLCTYPVVFRADGNGTMIALVPDVAGTMTVGQDRDEALARVHGALVLMLAARIESGQPIPRPSKPARGQRTVILSPIVTAKLSLYQAIRSRKITPAELGRQLGWDARRVRGVLNLGRHTKLDDIEAALEALGKRLVIDVHNAA